MNIRRHRPISRRTVLRGIGASIALPLLDAMGPARALAHAATTAGVGAAGAHPLRMAAIFLPNGVHYEDWEPQTLGHEYKLSPTLEALRGVKDDVLVLSNLALEN